MYKVRKEMRKMGMRLVPVVCGGDDPPPEIKLSRVPGHPKYTIESVIVKEAGLEESWRLYEEADEI